MIDRYPLVSDNPNFNFMHRRHFVKLSAATTAAVLFSRIADATGSGPLINIPDEVWAQTDAGWFQLKRSAHLLFTLDDIEVNLKQNGAAVGIYVQSPKTALKGVRLKWKYEVKPTLKSLGDHWERDYGDAAWVNPSGGVKNPWYVLLYDDKQTACFGVKTGCSAICWWVVNADSLELTLDTHTGGDGVQLGDRKLHAADIVTTDSTPKETPFLTAQRFCKLMCEKPRETTCLWY
jgi:alpha-galactosidase